MADDERTKTIRVTNNDQAILRLGVVRISNRDAQWVCKDCRCFNELDAVLLDVLVGLLTIPLEFHDSSVPALGSARPARECAAYPLISF